MVMSKGRTGLNPRAYLGVEASTPPNLVIETRAPTSNDSRNFNIGDLWLHYRSGFPATGDNEDIWMLIQLERDVATWVNFGGGDLETLTGNDAVVVGPDANDNINILGNNAVGLTVTGNAGTNTLTITSTSGNPFAQSLTGNTGGAISFDANGNIDIIADNTTVEFAGSGNQLLLDFGLSNLVLGDSLINVTTAVRSTGLGNFVLSALTSGSSNTAIGNLALTAMDVGSSNTAVGSLSLQAANSGTSLSNTAVGAFSLASLTTGAENDAFGQSSLNQLVTGSNNLALGISSGLNYVGAETNNILIANGGTAAENNTIRIGTTQTRNFQAGIAGVVVANRLNVVIDSTTGQLGTDPAQPVSFLAYLSADAVDVTGAGTNYTIIFDTVIFNIGAAYDNTTGLFTAPNDGVYTFTWSPTIFDLTAAMTTGLSSLIVAGSGPSVGTWAGFRGNATAMQDLMAGFWRQNGSVTVFLNAGDTAQVVVQIAGGAGDTADIRGSAAPFRTNFTGVRQP